MADTPFANRRRTTELLVAVLAGLIAWQLLSPAYGWFVWGWVTLCSLPPTPEPRTWANIGAESA